MNLDNIHEFAWWYLYIQILNAENEKRKEIHELIESLLPWLNLELWQEIQKKREDVRENVDFDDQLRAMLDGTWDTDPNAAQVPRVDELASSATSGSATPSSAAQMFNQRPRTIRDTLFPGQGPSFQGDVSDIPPEYRDFYKDLPGLEEFPPDPIDKEK